MLICNMFSLETNSISQPQFVDTCRWVALTPRGWEYALRSDCIKLDSRDCRRIVACDIELSIVDKLKVILIANDCHPIK